MQSKASSVEAYLKEMPEDRRAAIEKLRTVITSNLPKGFQEVMNYGMIGYVVPHELYPAGYHCNPKDPLPFAGLANQKNSISFYHMGIYIMPELLDWFQSTYPQHAKSKLDMGKSCIRFKKIDDIPYQLIGQLMKKMKVKDWIQVYEDKLKSR
ncbi:MAG: DUF1801 domain-containing protein [Bacteroidetes bacterium]|jgi:uncharacterized protein YdhG (YjbR/CyaY superfamily)|nr:DUF1801 domain-containing protein [Bacteroidota bacterium]